MTSTTQEMTLPTLEMTSTTPEMTSTTEKTPGNCQFHILQTKIFI
jgi:hypothetical protein